MNQANILVVDDEPDIRHLVQEILQDEGYKVDVAENASSARTICESFDPDLVLLDIWMPDEDGITLLKEWKQVQAQTFQVIMMSGHGTVETAVEATRLGAYDFVEKPLSLAKLLLTVEKALADSPKGVARTNKSNAPDWVGDSAVFKTLREQAETIADRDMPVLIAGEAGVGKTTLARYMHALSRRHNGEFVNYGPVAKLGLVETFANLPDSGGTFYISELGELTPSQQTFLLQHLQSSKAQAFPGGWRVLAGTQMDLDTQVHAERLRKDVYFRINALRLQVPSLRERREDIPGLLEYFVNFFLQTEGLSYRHFNVAAQNRLRNYDWPGNVNELKNIIQRLMVFGREVEIDLQEVEKVLPVKTKLNADASGIPLPLNLPLRQAREEFERHYLLQQLETVAGNMSELAKRTGMERTHLYRKLRSLGIEYQKNRH